ncbi:MAG: hypothetical protein KIH67_003215 [Candidatus Moranbacteria bacterium]|nr:hypothetical protein [Candidatus Moranbacteria bacterium]
MAAGFDIGAASMAWDAFKAFRAMSGEKLTQQKADGILPTLDDEAILLAVDQAVARLKPEGPLNVDGLVVMRKIAALRSKRLKPHQRERWRKIIATLVLTEHFEKFETSVVTKTPAQAATPQAGAQGQNQQGKKGGLHEVIRNFQRFPKDYEYTSEDPRVGHLVYVASLIKSDTPNYDEKSGHDDFKAAYEYLLGNFFDEKSISELAIEKAQKLQAAIASGAYDALISLGMSDRFEAAEGAVLISDPKRIEKLNALYEEAFEAAFADKRGQIEAHRDGITIPQKGKWNAEGEYMITRLEKKIPTYWSWQTWIFILITIAILVIAYRNTGS